MSNPNNEGPPGAANAPRGALLLKRLLIFFGIITIFIVAWVLMTYLSAARNRAEAFMQQSTEKAGNQLSNFFDPVQSAATIFKGWAESGKLGRLSAATLNALVIPLLDQLPQVYSLEVFDAKRLLYMLRRDDRGWLAYENVHSPQGKGRPVWIHLGADSAEMKRWAAEKTTGSADLQWLGDVLTTARRGPFWTGPHPLPFKKISAYSSVISWKQDSSSYAAAFNIRVSDIRQQLASLRFTESGFTFLFDPDPPSISGGQPHPLPDVITDEETPGRSEPILRQAIRVWRERGKPVEAFRFQADKMRWWGQLVRLKGSKSRGAGMGVVVPEKELQALQQRDGYLYILAALVVLWIGLLVFSRKYLREAARQRHPFDTRQLPEDVIRRMIEGGESEWLEFKSTLRWNLKADRPGKEIELASLKTVAAFMNSDGGTLLVGVSDDGTVTGTAADRFENDDKYLQHFSNIFKQHIGLEFSEYVEFALRPVGDRQVLVVTCRKSVRPVFLRNKKDEHFYIRSGPSSRDLTPSQMLEYVQERFD